MAVYLGSGLEVRTSRPISLPGGHGVPDIGSRPPTSSRVSIAEVFPLRSKNVVVTAAVAEPGDRSPEEGLRSGFSLSGQGRGTIEVFGRRVEFSIEEIDQTESHPQFRRKLLRRSVADYPTDLRAAGARARQMPDSRERDGGE